MTSDKLLLRAYILWLSFLTVTVKKLHSVKCSQNVPENDSGLFVADTVDIIKLMSVKAFVAVFE